MRNHIVIFLCMLLGNCSLFAQQVRVDWVHGLNSDESFWLPYRTFFEETRQIDGFFSSNGDAGLVFPNNGLHVYRTNEGVASFADRVQLTINHGIPGLGIGHSMGALSVREVSRRDPGAFRGMILCGSPLKGAAIMNAIQDGRASAYIDNAAWQLTRGPRAQLGSAGALFYVVGGIVVNKIKDNMRDDLFGSYGERTIADLAENSTYMNQINAVPKEQQIPHVMLWGNENSPMHLRGWSSQERASDRLPWENGDDEKWVRQFNTMYDVYNATAIINLGGAVVAAIGLQFGISGYFTFVAHEWRKGAKYMRDESESQFAELIGANKDHLIRYITYRTDECTDEQRRKCTYEVFYPYSGTGLAPPPGIILWERYNQCLSSCNNRLVTREIRIPIQQGSDGTVAAYSALAQDTPWEVPATEQYQVEGCNHMEMRGHPNMTAQLENVFDRQNDPIFNVPR